LTAVAAGILVAFVLPRQDEILEQLAADQAVDPRRLHDPGTHHQVERPPVRGHHPRPPAEPRLTVGRKQELRGRGGWR
ncbi:hypothetical protein ACWD1Z_36090, partial [Streptomyces sp. NPDC002784]